MGTADDPDNLRGRDDSRAGSDATFSTYSSEREEEARGGDPDV